MVLGDMSQVIGLLIVRLSTQPLRHKDPRVEGWNYKRCSKLVGQPATATMSVFI